MTKVVRLVIKPVERLLNEPFGGHVHAGCRFVENENRRIFEQRARYREALFLPDAKLHAAFSELAVKSVRKAANELRGVSGLERRPEFIFGGLGLPDAKVFGGRAIKEKTLLGHHGDHLPEATA